MKYPLYLLAVLAVAACAGPEGNPDGQPYANEPGGMIAVRPEAAAATNYNPYAAQPAYDGVLQAPPPPPSMPLPPANPPPAR